MKKLLELCTKELHFSFDEKIFRQVNGVAMGSPLGPVIANIFMVELEKQLIPTMGDDLDLWFRYVDDTFTFIKKEKVDDVIRILNNFHERIKFTYEKESNNSIAFLDVTVLRKTDGSFDTDIHRKKTDTNVYLNWNSCVMCMLIISFCYLYLGPCMLMLVGSKYIQSIKLSW